MPRAKGSKDYTSLVQGLVTEASPLAYPEGSTADEKNFLLDPDGGVRKRRKGYQSFSQEFSVQGSGKVLYSGYWKSADRLFVITSTDQGTYLNIHRNDNDRTRRSSVQVYTEELDTVSVSEARGDLVITGGYGGQSVKPLMIHQDTEDLGYVYEIALHFRDFKLIEDGLRVSERPVTLTDEHKYNLLNAGWYADRKLAKRFAGEDPYDSPIDNFFKSQSEYPSNADIASLGVKVNDDGDLVFSGDTIKETITGNSEAARGHYVYPISNVHRQSRVDNPEDDGATSTTLSIKTTVTL